MEESVRGKGVFLSYRDSIIIQRSTNINRSKEYCSQGKSHTLSVRKSVCSSDMVLAGHLSLLRALNLPFASSGGG